MIKLLDLPTEILEHVISYIRPPRQAISLEEVQALFRLRAVNAAFSRHLSPAVILSSIEIRLSDQGRIDSGPVIQRLASSGLCAAIASLSILDDFDTQLYRHLEEDEKIWTYISDQYAFNGALKALLQQCSATTRHFSVTSHFLTNFDWSFRRPAWTLTHLATTWELCLYFPKILPSVPTLRAIAVITTTSSQLADTDYPEQSLSELSSTRVPRRITDLYIEHVDRKPMPDILRVLPIQPVHLALTLRPGQTAGVSDVLRTVATSAHLSKRLAKLSIAGVHDASEVKRSMALPEEMPASVKVQLLEDPIGNRPFWVPV